MECTELGIGELVREVVQKKISGGLAARQMLICCATLGETTYLLSLNHHIKKKGCVCVWREGVKF